MVVVRRNIYSLSQAEIDKLITGIRAVKRSGAYDQLIQTHYQNINQVHQTPMFLPWHRAFLIYYESLLQKALGDPNFGLPYWDWTDDVNSPHQIGKLWSAGMMGGTGSPVATGPFVPSQWVTVGTPPGGRFGAQLDRNLGGTGKPVTTTTDVLRLYLEYEYDSFRIALERGPHGIMHLWVGGQMGDPPNAPNDPVFWLHHANVDRIWAQWQELNPNLPISAPDFNSGTQMPPVQPGVQGDKVATVINAPFSRYYYDRFYIADVTWSDDFLIPDSRNALGASASPALAVFREQLYCVRQGRDDSGWTYCATTDGLNWSKDTLIPNPDNAYGVSDSPALAVFGGKLYCVRQGRGNSGWAYCGTTSDGTHWSGDTLIPNPDNAYGVTGSPALAVFGGKLYCVRQGRGNSGWTYCGTSTDGINWSGDALIPNPDNAYGLVGSPALAVFGGKLYCVRQGRSSGGTFCGTTSDGINWSADTSIPNPGNPYQVWDSPALASFGGKLYCVRQGTAGFPPLGSGQTLCATFDGNSWSADTPIRDANHPYAVSRSPALAVFSRHLYCVRQDSGWTRCATASLKIP